MVEVFIKTESHYSVNRKRIRDTIERYLFGKGVKGKAEVSVAIVGDRLMKKLNSKYRSNDKTTVVLAFPLADEGLRKPFVDVPDGVLRLGDIIISYPQVIELASSENCLVDEKIDELLIHGLNHLLGTGEV
ncbi:rRNA maturation RNase YbeY [Candidatus Gottesmanbacteria bacterium]|nr:rRNA maturation RNase YbeY [Candidatus Gottesmanbacteria bacterium]